jgi:hypothetical protein
MPVSGSALNRIRPRPTAAAATAARPTANAKREFLPGYTSARPRAATHKADDGLIGGKPATQLDSRGGPTHPPMSTAAAIITAAKPAA